MLCPIFAAAKSLKASAVLPGEDDTAAAGEDKGEVAGVAPAVGLAAVVADGELVAGLELVVAVELAVATAKLEVELVLVLVLELGLGLELVATGADEVLGVTGPAGVVLGVWGMMVGAGVAPGEGLVPGVGEAGTAATTAAVLTTTACDCWFRHSATDG